MHMSIQESVTGPLLWTLAAGARGAINGRELLTKLLGF